MVLYEAASFLPENTAMLINTRCFSDLFRTRRDLFSSPYYLFCTHSDLLSGVHVVRRMGKIVSTEVIFREKQSCEKDISKTFEDFPALYGSLEIGDFNEDSLSEKFFCAALNRKHTPSINHFTKNLFFQRYM